MRALSLSDAASPRRRTCPCSAASARPRGCRTASSATRMPKPVRSRMRSMPASTVLGLPISAVPLSIRPSAVSLAAAQRPAHADEILHRAHRGVAGRHQHLEGLAQEVVEQGLDRPPRLLARALIGLGDIDRAGPAELIRPPPRSRIAAPGRDRCCGSARRGRPTRRSPGTDICAWDRRPRRRSRSTPATGSTPAGAGSGRAAARD